MQRGSNPHHQMTALAEPAQQTVTSLVIIVLGKDEKIDGYTSAKVYGEIGFDKETHKRKLVDLGRHDSLRVFEKHNGMDFIARNIVRLFGMKCVLPKGFMACASLGVSGQYII